MLRCYYNIEVFGKNRHIKTKPKLSHSFVEAFLKILYREVSTLSYDSIDITNTTRSSANDQSQLRSISKGGGSRNFSYNSTSGEEGHLASIVVGTGSTAVAVTDYGLETIIDHGIAAGKLEYFGSMASAITVNATTDEATFTIERIFRNESGGSITVNEIGLYGTGHIAGVSHCFIRDLIGGGQAVADTEYLKVTYTIKIAT